MSCNEDIRRAIKLNGLNQSDLAIYLNRTPGWVSWKLRKELPKDQKDFFRKVIKEAKAEMYGG